MAEAAEEKVAGKLVSAGEPQEFKPNRPSQNGGAAATDNSNGAADDKNKNAAPADDKNKQPDPVVADPTDEQMKAFFAKHNIEFDSVESLKQKLTPPAAAKAEPTEEEKAEQSRQREQRLIGVHLSLKDKEGKPATTEQFTALRQILQEDKRQLGLNKEIEDLMKGGFTKERAEELARERHFQFSDEEIEAIQDKDEKEATIKQRAFGTQKLENKGAYIQKQAKGYFDILQKRIDDDDADAKLKEEHTAKVADAFNKYERKLQLSIGQIEEKDVSPIDFEVSQSALDAAKAMLNDRAEFEKQLQTADGHVNLDWIIPHLVKSLSWDDAVKRTYLTAQDRAVEDFKKVFGAVPPKLGSESRNNGQKGKLVSAGEPTEFKPHARKQA